MSATADGADGADDHAYFRAVEEIFISLRGAPLLLSPADWQVARRWHRQGVPLGLVESALEGLFARRRERGTRGRVQSLRYCAPAVERAWEELVELQAPGERETAGALELAPRLTALASALPPTLPGRAAAAARIRALSGEAAAVEEALAELDRELLAAAGEALPAAERAALAAEAASSLAPLAGRLPPEQAAAARQRLERRLLRRRIGLPLLSLFSPEAEADS